MKKADARVHELAATQHQLVTRAQFLEFGSRDQLQRRQASGSLVRLHESVYRIPGFAPSWKQRILAVCLSGGRPSAASHRTAAKLTDLPGGEEIVEITFPRHRRAQYEDVVVHESRYLTEQDIVEIDGIPVTRAARTICDLAGLVEMRQMPRETVEHALLEAVRRDLVDIPRVWREHERLASTFRLGGTVMLDILTNFVAPRRATESPAETSVLQILRAGGLPEPIPQFWLTLPDGQRIRLDFAWPKRRTTLEWDPYKFHGDRRAYERMAERTRLLRTIGWERVSVTDDDLDAGMPQSLAAVRAALSRRR